MSESSSSGGIGFCGLLTILFIGLKLGGVIGWSWVWVLAPLWIPAVMVLVAFSFGFLFMLVCAGMTALAVKRGLK